MPRNGHHALTGLSDAMDSEHNVMAAAALGWC